MSYANPYQSRSQNVAHLVDAGPQWTALDVPLIGEISEVQHTIGRVILAVGVVMLFGCGGSSGSPTSPDSTTSAEEGLTATIEGQRIRMPLVYGTVFKVGPRSILWIMARENCTGAWGIDLRVERLPPGELLTTGVYSTVKTFTVTQPQPTGLDPGVYREMHAILSHEGQNLYWDAPDLNGAGSGQATVTSVSSGVAQGTFSFDAQSRTGVNPRSVTGGSFRVQLIERRLC